MITLFGCSQTKYVPEGKFLLKKNTVQLSGDKKNVDKDDLAEIIRQQPNYKRVGIKWKLMAFNMVDSTKVADKRHRKNLKLREKNRNLLKRQDRINGRRIARAHRKGRTLYTHKTIILKDTINPRKFFREWYKYEVGRPPVVFDSIPYNKTLEQMQAFLRSRGYYYGQVTGGINYKKSGKSVVNYEVVTGERYMIDSVYYVIDNNAVQESYEVFLDIQHDPPLINQPFDSEMLDDYRSKVSKFMRDSSFYGFSSSHITFLADTNQTDMTVSIGVKFGDRMVKSIENRDSLIAIKHAKTRIRNVFFHIGDTMLFEGDFKAKMADLGLNLYNGTFLNTMDTLHYHRVKLKGSDDLDSSRMATFYLNERAFVKPRILEMQNYLEETGPYKEKFAEASYNSLLQMGLFDAIKTDLVPIDGTNELDVHYYLGPAKKQSYSFNPKATNSNGFLGVSVSLDYTNRNLFRGAERLTLSLSGGFESQPPVFDQTIDGGNTQSSGRSFNTFEIGPSVKLELPGLFPLRMSRISKKRRPQTIISSAYNFQNREDFIRRIFQMNYAWKFIVSKTSVFEIGLPAISVVKFVNINKTEDFENKLNALNDLFLINAYSNQFIWQDWRFRYEFNIKDKPNRRRNYQLYFSTVFDPAGNILSGFRKFQDTTASGQYAINGVAYSQFSRIDNELIYSKPLGKERSLSMKLQIGGGLPYGNSHTSLPYDYSFFAGGANDNRGWIARSLGPGSYKYYLDTNSTATQIGDFKLGASGEYRFAFNSFFKGALFVDAGNVWSRYYDVNRQGGQLSANWWNEIAVAAGFGLRMDLEYFILRVDLGIPVRNPALPVGARWITQSRDPYYAEGLATFGPDYINIMPLPFIPRFHFGIGYPF